MPKIGLIHNHPFLAEYKKFIEISDGKDFLGKFELFPDTGGYSWVSLYLTKNGNIIVQDFGNWGLAIDLNLKTVDRINNHRNKNWKYLGSFNFDIPKREIYSFINAKDDPTEPISRVQGG